MPDDAPPLAWVLMAARNHQEISYVLSGYLKAMGPATFSVQTLKIRTSGDLKVPRGSSAEILASISGKGDSAGIHYQQEGQSWREQPMQPVQEGNGDFRFELTSVNAPVIYYVSSQGSASLLATVRPIDPPRIEKFVYHVTPPAYTRLKSWSAETPEGHLEAPTGSQIGMTIAVNNDLAGAEIRFSSEDIRAMSGDGLRSASCSLKLDAPVSFLVRLSDRFGFTTEDLGPYHLTPTVDQPPQIFIHHPPLVSDLANSARVVVDWEALDDYGISRVELCYQLNYMNLVRRFPLAVVAGTPVDASEDATQTVFEATSSVRLRNLWDLTSL